MMGGFEWVVDALTANAALLRDQGVVRRLLDEIVRTLELAVVGTPQLHQFPDPGGLTALYLLSESHLTIHTFPETGLATLNLYCCRPRPELDWEKLLGEHLGATRVSVRRLVRGG